MQSSADTLKKKIFIETSALIAASVRMTLHEGDVIEDEFYEESTQLFSLLTKYFGSRIGITTKTVETEAKRKLEEIVLETLEENAPEQDQSFAAKSYHWNRCLTRMDKYLAYLSIEPAPKELIAPLEEEITKMYKELAVSRKPNWRLEQEAREEVESRAQPPRTLHASIARIQQAKDEEIHTLYLLRVRDNLQLYRLHYNPASKTDVQILAEAVLIYRYYAANDPKFQLLLASCDSNNFCPYYSKEYGLSQPVTDGIQRRFRIRCERPVDLVRALRYDLEPPQEEEEEEEVADESEAVVEDEQTGDVDKPSN